MLFRSDHECGYDPVLDIDLELSCACLHVDSFGIGVCDAYESLYSQRARVIGQPGGLLTGLTGFTMLLLLIFHDLLFIRFVYPSKTLLLRRDFPVENLHE